MTILLTLDYELFLDDIVGTVVNCLVKPMLEFHKVCETRGVRATIFVDAAYLYMLNKLKRENKELQKDYDRVVENIQWLESVGHDIELHIHPQWYYSSYDNEGWHLDWEHYKLSTAPYEESLRLFTESKELLDEIIGRKTKVFRAGGYSIQQFNYQDCFKKNGIVADSSVFTNNKVLTETHYYNYSDTPSDMYRFDDDIIHIEDDGFITEFPISVGRFSFFEYMKEKKHFSKLATPKWGDGGSCNQVSYCHRIEGLVRRFMNGFSFVKYPSASLDCDSFGLLERIYNQNKHHQYMTVIGHPKNISSASMEYLETFVSMAQKEDNMFCTMKEALSI